MNESLTFISFLATAGFAEADMHSWWPLMAVAGSFAPIVWIFQGAWATLLGLVVLAADLATAVFVGRRIYWLLHQRLQVPEWLVGVPLLFATVGLIAVINVVCTLLVTWAVPDSVFA